MRHPKDTKMKKIIFALLILTCQLSASSQTLEDIIAPVADKQRKNTEKKESPNSYPTNFGESNLKDIAAFNEQILSFDVEIIQVEKSRRETPFYKGKIGNGTIWIYSMVNSESIKVGNIVRVVGYLVPTDELDTKINQDQFQVLSFGVLNLQNRKLDYFPGSEMQMKEWKEGKIPSTGE